MYLRCYKDWIFTINVYQCDLCKEEINEAHPHVIDNENTHYCWPCAFKLGKITDKEYIKCCGICLIGLRAAINPETGAIETTTTKFSWERKDKDYRHCKRYVDWRTSVFERDKYVCASCGIVGGDLEAHHILPFRSHKKQRYEVENGITLCKKCHRNYHKRKRGSCNG